MKDHTDMLQIPVVWLVGRTTYVWSYIRHRYISVSVTTADTIMKSTEFDKSLYITLHRHLQIEVEAALTACLK
jgi:hypothetical protein